MLSKWNLISDVIFNIYFICFQPEVEVVEQYSDPRDSKSKAYVEPGAESPLPTFYSRVNRNYCQPYTGEITFPLFTSFKLLSNAFQLKLEKSSIISAFDQSTWKIQVL